MSLFNSFASFFFKSAETLKYHVVKQYLSEESMRNGGEYSSWLGDNYLVKVTKPGQGMVSGITSGYSQNAQRVLFAT